MALKLISSLDMNDIKQEDVMLYDEGGQGNVSGAAVVADGATGFLKDVDVRGNLVSLPDIVSGGYSSARVWAEKLAKRLLANMADERLGLRQVLKLSVGEATRQVQPLFGSCERFRTPSAAVIAVRQRGSRWEAVGSGDCCLLLEYRDGRLETVVGSSVLEKIRAAREAEIRREKPDFDNLSAEEKAKVRYFYMKQTRQSLGVFPGGYWVPFYGGDAVLDRFIGGVEPVSAAGRKINYLNRGDVWEMSVSASELKSFMLSSDGFIEKVLKFGLADAAELAAAGKTFSSLAALGQKLRQYELKSAGDVSASAMKVVQGKKETGSADDAMAMCFEIV